MEPTDIERKHLETHVELCAQRYKFLENKLDTVSEKVSELERVVYEIHDMIASMRDKRNDQLIGWGVGVIVSLMGIIGWLLSVYVIS